MSKREREKGVSIRRILFLSMLCLALLMILIVIGILAVYRLVFHQTGELIMLDPARITVGAVAALLAFGLLAAMMSYALSLAVSSRIERFANAAGQVGEGRGTELPSTNIAELDTLAQVLSGMNRDLIQNASRMSDVVDLIGLPMGTYEIKSEKDQIFITDSLCRLLALPPTECGFMSADGFRRHFPSLVLSPEEGKTEEREISLGSGAAARWLRVVCLRRRGTLYGAVIDITEEVNRRNWLKFERDYDPLTNLLNRNSYPERMESLIDDAPDRMGVLLFGDLDNLKYLNDTYGHDMGDRYIQMAAGALKEFESLSGVVARIAGDEFAVYFHGADNRDALRRQVDTVLEGVRATAMELPGGKVQTVDISIGLAYYPEDATDIETLIKYADFAMYEVKFNDKGGVREFDLESYKHSNYALRKPNHLDFLIANRRLQFAFQPILDGNTGEVFGYEALMRPRIREIHTPMELISAARDQEKLYQVERLTLVCVLEWLEVHRHVMEDKRLFVNLIASQVLTNDDLNEVRRLFPKNSETVVMEVSRDGGEREECVTTQKVREVRDLGCQLALDDFGSGYNGEFSLTAISPDYIKVDMNVIRGIDTNPENQEVLRRTTAFAKSHGAYVIAEGIETREELETVLRLGARYVQGYYLGRPELELGLHNRDACAVIREIAEDAAPVEGLATI